MSTQTEVAVAPAPAAHADTVQAFFAQLRRMREEIPNLVFPTSANALQRLASAASLPPEFVELTAVAVTNSAPLVHGGGADPALTRDLMKYAQAYEPLADELEALAHFVRFSVFWARNKAGSSALTTYALAQRLAKRPETAELAPHVEDMRRALGNRGTKRSKPARAPSTESAAPSPEATDSPEDPPE